MAVVLGAVVGLATWQLVTPRRDSAGYRLIPGWTGAFLAGAGTSKYWVVPASGSHAVPGVNHDGTIEFVVPPGTYDLYTGVNGPCDKGPPLFHVAAGAHTDVNDSPPLRFGLVGCLS